MHINEIKEAIRNKDITGMTENESLFIHVLTLNDDNTHDAHTVLDGHMDCLTASIVETMLKDEDVCRFVMKAALAYDEYIHNKIIEGFDSCVESLDKCVNALENIIPKKKRRTKSNLSRVK